MDTTYGQAVALAVPVFVALIAVEIAADRVRGTRYYHLADAINNLSCGILSTGMRVFFGFIGLFTYEWTLNHVAPVRLASSHWLTWVFAFVFFDFCYYWQHRLGHTVGLFWAAHSVHHQSEEFNLTTALRQPGTGSFSSWMFYLPLAVCGVPLSVFLLTGVAQLFYQFWPHTRHIGRMGILDRWIQTPSNHRVHHAQNDVYLDKNYVGVFLLWDHLFGTFQEEREDEPIVYGVRGQLKSWNPVWANLHYYAVMAGDSWHAASWADKLRVWFAPPGWRPADVAARFPKPAYDPRHDFARFDPSRKLALSVYVLAQFGVLMAANSHFLALLPKQSGWWNLAYFAFILVSLVTLGGVLENRREFVKLELVRAVSVGAALLGTGSWFGGIRDARIVWTLAGLAAASAILLAITLWRVPAAFDRGLW
ncbi:MAG TPA: sterol desaturase family protein [Candidatus Sulfopaludibacter sp.]|jgi:sterol desaturase/sphingolipid hydroxylase (fatty acid hydroxylase superfamily)|nr:sterol desaturase family protein [Candidatus Sulfopaludibacter sp.]